ncbi:MAG: class I SAM-dependent methyltransferase, partial [Pyrinomonadaceae bacterium]
LPLTRYLSEQGSYLGMDIVKSGVDWCTEKYTSKHANFKFQLIDVYNDLYNPEGKYKAAEYRFPFPDEQFDFVVLNSVFTHMLPAEVENYLSEIARVLRTGGRCLISFFLLNGESLRLVELGRSNINLSHKIGPARAVSREKPELAIGYDENYVSGLYENCGLKIRQPVSYGSWCGRENY